MTHRRYVHTDPVFDAVVRRREAKEYRMAKSKESSFKVHKVPPVQPKSRTTVAQTPTSSPGISPSKSYTAQVPVAGGERIVNRGRKD